MLALSRINPGELIEIRDLTRNPDWQVTCIKAGDSFNATFALKNRTAECIFPDSIGTHNSEAGDDCAFEHDWGSPDVSA
jgi:hypothetical protein